MLIQDVFVQKHIDEVAHLSEESVTFKRKRKIKTSERGKREAGRRETLPGCISSHCKSTVSVGSALHRRGVIIITFYITETCHPNAARDLQITDKWKKEYWQVYFSHEY